MAILTLELAPTPDAATVARWSVEALREQMPAETLDTCRFLVTELVNTVLRRAGTEPTVEIRVAVTLVAERVRVEVAGPESEDPAPASLESSWSLLFLSAMAEDWGTSNEGEQHRIWFELPVTMTTSHAAG